MASDEDLLYVMTPFKARRYIADGAVLELDPPQVMTPGVYRPVIDDEGLHFELVALGVWQRPRVEPVPTPTGAVDARGSRNARDRDRRRRGPA